MAKIKVTTTIHVMPTYSNNEGDWNLTDSEIFESGNPLFHAAEIDERLATLDRRILKQVKARFGTPDSA